MHLEREIAGRGGPPDEVVVSLLRVVQALAVIVALVTAASAGERAPRPAHTKAPVPEPHQSGAPVGRAFVIEGAVTPPLGPLERGEILLYPWPATVVGLDHLRQGVTAADGSFVFRDVSPGTYRLFLRTQSTLPGSRSQFATEAVAVRDNVTGLVLRRRPGSSVRGRLSIDGEREFRGWQVVAVPADRNPPAWAVAIPAPVTAAGEFRLDDVVGRVVLRVQRDAEFVAVSQVEYRGEDVTDAPREYGAEGDAEVHVAVVLGRSSIRGRLLRRGRAARYDCIVFAFPDRHRDTWHPLASYSASVPCGEDSTYVFHGLNPGTYRVVAVSGEELVRKILDDEWRPVADRALSVSVGDGITASQDIPAPGDR